MPSPRQPRSSSSTPRARRRATEKIIAPIERLAAGGAAEAEGDAEGTTRPARVAVVGSRDYPELDAVRAYVRRLPAGTVLISGGAAGVDRTAAQEARARGLTVIEHRPDWQGHGRSAGPIRNRQIVADADRVVAFWDGESRGTKNSIDIARAAGKAVEIVRPTASEALLPGFTTLPLLTTRADIDAYLDRDKCRHGEE